MIDSYYHLVDDDSLDKNTGLYMLKPSSNIYVMDYLFGV